MPFATILVRFSIMHAEALFISLDLIELFKFVVFLLELSKGATGHYTTIGHIFKHVWVVFYHFFEAKLPTLIDLDNPWLSTFYWLLSQIPFSVKDGSTPAKAGRTLACRALLYLFICKRTCFLLLLVWRLLSLQIIRIRFFLIYILRIILNKSSISCFRILFLFWTWNQLMRIENFITCPRIPMLYIYIILFVSIIIIMVLILRTNLILRNMLGIRTVLVLRAVILIIISVVGIQFIVRIVWATCILAIVIVIAFFLVLLFFFLLLFDLILIQISKSFFENFDTIVLPLNGSFQLPLLFLHFFNLFLMLIVHIHKFLL